jgi:hypothetical protein
MSVVASTRCAPRPNGAEGDVLGITVLAQQDHQYQSFTVVRYETPDKVEPVEIVTRYPSEDSSILAYKLLSVEGGYTFEVRSTSIPSWLSTWAQRAAVIAEISFSTFP